MRTAEQIDNEITQLLKEKDGLKQQNLDSVKTTKIYKDIVGIEKQLKSFKHKINCNITISWEYDGMGFIDYNNPTDYIDFSDINQVIKHTPKTDKNISKLKLIKKYNELTDKFYTKYGYYHTDIK